MQAFANPFERLPAATMDLSPRFPNVEFPKRHTHTHTPLVSTRRLLIEPQDQLETRRVLAAKSLELVEWLCDADSDSQDKHDISFWNI